MKCKNCGTENPENVKFCKYCGTGLPAAEQVQGAKIKRVHIILMCIAVLLLLAGGISLIFLLGTHDNEDFVQTEDINPLLEEVAESEQETNSTTEAYNVTNQTIPDTDITWSLMDGTLTIKGNGDMPDWEYWQSPWNHITSITNIIIEHGITSIGSNAFPRCTGFTSILIPNGVTSIGNHAFSNCKSLTAITIPDSVTSIGKGAFETCTHLASVIMSNNITEIGESAFYQCINLNSISIPNGVTNIEFCTFGSCTNLTSVIIPNSVTEIENYAFSDCTSLTSIKIPNDVSWIGGNAFSKCISLTDIYYTGTQEEWSAIEIDYGNDFNDPLRTAAIHYNS